MLRSDCCQANRHRTHEQDNCSAATATATAESADRRQLASAWFAWSGANECNRRRFRWRNRDSTSHEARCYGRNRSSWWLRWFQPADRRNTTAVRSRRSQRRTHERASAQSAKCWKIRLEAAQAFELEEVERTETAEGFRSCEASNGSTAENAPTVIRGGPRPDRTRAVHRAAVRIRWSAWWQSQWTVTRRSAATATPSRTHVHA